MTSLLVVAAALVTAIATGLGAAPFAFRRGRTVTWLGPANGIASGVMLAASAALLIEGASRNTFRTGVGAIVGALFVIAATRAVGNGPAMHLGRLRGADARKALLIVGVMTAHSAAEGVGISLVLVPRGSRVGEAAWWSVFSSLPQPLLALPAFLFVEQFTAILPAGLGFAAGAMIWMVGREVLPEALAQGPRRLVVADAAIAFALMLALQLRLAV